MPTLLKWQFVGGLAHADRDGEQRAFAGDNVVVTDPDLGICTLESVLEQRDASTRERQRASAL